MRKKGKKLPFLEPAKTIGYGELLAFDRGYTTIIGVDEAGRGPLAGPVVAASIYLNGDKPKFVNDSKKLTEKKRLELYQMLTTNYKYGVGVVSAKEIDKINILQASKKAMLISILKLKKSINFDLVLVDGNQRIDNLSDQQITIVKGDSLSYSIAAASIIAKVLRDKLMKNYSLKYPVYKFEKHKGYPTKEHIELVKKYGITKIHRLSFKPIKELI